MAPRAKNNIVRGESGHGEKMLESDVPIHPVIPNPPRLTELYSLLGLSGRCKPGCKIHAHVFIAHVFIAVCTRESLLSTYLLQHWDARVSCTLCECRTWEGIVIIARGEASGLLRLISTDYSRSLGSLVCFRFSESSG